MKKILALVLALVMILPGLTGCGSKNSNSNSGSSSSKDNASDEELKELYSTVVMTVGGMDVTYETYRYYFYGVVSAAMQSNKEHYSTEEGMKELREDILSEIRFQCAVKKLAEQYGISLSETDLKQVDSYISTMDYYYQTQYQQSYESFLAEYYTTLDVYKEQLACSRLSANLYEYLEDDEHGAIDLSDEAVAEFLEDYYCTLHILLTKDNYTSEENTLRLAEELRKFLLVTESVADDILEKELTREEAFSSIETIEAAYNEGKSAFSFMGSLSTYNALLSAIKEELATPHSCVSYLKSTVDKLSDSHDAVKTVKELSEDLSKNGITEQTAEALEKAYTAYKTYIAESKSGFFSGATDSYLTTKQCDVLYALELLKASLTGEESALLDQLKNAVRMAFNYCILVFGEDRQDHENGVYFLKGETNEDFEKAYLALQVGQISQPVKTDFGIHLILRCENDPEYFKESQYRDAVISKMLDDLSEELEVSFKEIYYTITLENLK